MSEIYAGASVKNTGEGRPSIYFRLPTPPLKKNELDSLRKFPGHGPEICQTCSVIFARDCPETPLKRFGHFPDKFPNVVISRIFPGLLPETYRTFLGTFLGTFHGPGLTRITTLP